MITSFIIHYPDQKTTARKMQMRSNSANSAMVSRQSSPRSRTPALPTSGGRKRSGWISTVGASRNRVRHSVRSTLADFSLPIRMSRSGLLRVSRPTGNYRASYSTTACLRPHRIQWVSSSSVRSAPQVSPQDIVVEPTRTGELQRCRYTTSSVWQARWLSPCC
jgi:hypothetical protein